MTVGVVVVSHSRRLAEGVCEVAGQMSPDVRIRAAGGTDEDGIGTSVDRASAALAEADTGDGVVVLYDLGSALMTADLVLELLPDAQRERIRVVDAPLVEGALAAAVAAQQGADVDQVAAAARSALAAPSTDTGTPGVNASEPAAAAIAPPQVGQDTAEPDTTVVARTVTLRNPLGLHARPAATLARLVTGGDTTVEVGRPGQRGVDVRSVLAVVAQGMRGGEQVQLRGRGPQAAELVERIASAIATGFGELPEDLTAASASTPGEPASTGGPEPRAGDRVTPEAGAATGTLQGTGAVAGVAAGPARWLRMAPEEPPEISTDQDAAASDPMVQQRLLLAALDRVETALAGTVGASIGDIAEAHRALLSDPMLREEALRDITAGTPADRAWWNAVTRARQLFAAVDDPVVRERAADIVDVGRRVLAELRPDATPQLIEDRALIQGSVVLADDVLPSLVGELAAAGAVGLVLSGGGATSHAVVVARGLELPTIIGVGPALQEVTDGTTVVIDGERGLLRIAPSAQDVAAAQREREQRAARRQELRAHARTPVVRRGQPIRVEANVASAAEATAALEAGADGVGLLRTEVAFLDRPRLPTEEEQVEQLTAILQVLADRPVTVRTLDVGGDKPMRALHLDPLRHGFLGQRGLRYGLEHPELLHTQLRAILRAAAGRHAPLGLMAPMVTTVEEIEAFRAAIDRAVRSLREDQLAYALPTEIGVMVEVPAAALNAEQICYHVDFVSVGSNDLVQYLMAAERGNPAVAHLYRPDHPAVWRTLELLVTAAAAVGCRVAVCGEMAGDPALAVRLVDLGVTELSMAPASIPEVKAALRE